ncbi:MAG: hypothetical protein M3380_09325 [Chloroflexota bacterium]|nr:hypothetical protein [Chloroflexota bacterium]
MTAAQGQLFQACAVRNLQLWLARRNRRQAPNAVKHPQSTLEVQQAA